MLDKLRGLQSAIKQRLAAIVKLLSNPRQILVWLRDLPRAISAWYKAAFIDNFKRVWSVGQPFWVSPQRRYGYMLLGVVLAFVAFNAGVNKMLADVSVPYNNFMKDGPWDPWLAAAFYYLVWMAISSAIQSGSNASRTTLQLVWRHWITSNLSELYLTARNYLWFNQDTREDKPDNPDQRNTQDVDTYTNNSVNLSMSALDSIVAIMIMGYTLWTIRPQLILWSMACAVFISTAVWLLGRSLRDLNNQWFKTEADLRFVYQQTRDEAEGIALARGESIVRETAAQSLDNVIGTLLRWRWVSLRMQLCTILYYQAVNILPVALTVGLYYRGDLEFGVLNKALIAFAAVTGGFCFFVNNFPALMTYFTVSQRIYDMYATLRGYQNDQQREGNITIVEGEVPSFENLTLVNELDQPLIVDLTIVFDKNTLITGPDLMSKGVLLKALDGVLRRGTGKVTRPPLTQLMFLTQAPWMPTCSLSKVLTYGLDGSFTEEEQLAVLKKVQLPDLATQVGGLDKAQTKNWRKLLPSVAQHQRLALARVLLAKPKFVFLDKATVSLEEENEELFYQLLAEIGSKVISTATGTRLAKFHDQVLEVLGHPVDGKKNWELHPVAAEYKVPGWKLLLKQVGILDNPAPAE